MMIEPGRVLAGRYRLVSAIGRGSQADVWLADHLALSTRVAVKLIDPDLAKDPGACERFRREATAAAQLRSTHVVQTLDHGIDEGQPFIVMELLQGQDLFDRLDQLGRISLSDTATILVQVARALTRAHQLGIVHRDLKPENVFLVQEDDTEVAKVLDFGVAKLTYAERLTMQGSGAPALVGTPQYMSPEQVRGDEELDPRSDVWSVGVLAYQCAVGELPFDSPNLAEILLQITVREAPVPSRKNPDLPPSFDEWFKRSCARDPEQRFTTAREQAEALRKLADVRLDPALSYPPPAAVVTPIQVEPPAVPRAPALPSLAAPLKLDDADLAPEDADEMARTVQMSREHLLADAPDALPGESPRATHRLVSGGAPAARLSDDVPTVAGRREQFDASEADLDWGKQTAQRERPAPSADELALFAAVQPVALHTAIAQPVAPAVAPAGALPGDASAAVTSAAPVGAAPGSLAPPTRVASSGPSLWIGALVVAVVTTFVALLALVLTECASPSGPTPSGRARATGATSSPAP